MDMFHSEYIKVTYFWPKSAKKSFCVWRVSKKLKKNWKKLIFFFVIIILTIIYEMCQHLGSFRSLWKAPKTKTWKENQGRIKICHRRKIDDSFMRLHDWLWHILIRISVVILIKQLQYQYIGTVQVTVYHQTQIETSVTNHQTWKHTYLVYWSFKLILKSNKSHIKIILHKVRS